MTSMKWRNINIIYILFNNRYLSLMDTPCDFDDSFLKLFEERLAQSPKMKKTLRNCVFLWMLMSVLLFFWHRHQGPLSCIMYGNLFVISLFFVDRNQMDFLIKAVKCACDSIKIRKTHVWFCGEFFFIN